jgi:hypothetical protein
LEAAAGQEADAGIGDLRAGGWRLLRLGSSTKLLAGNGAEHIRGAAGSAGVSFQPPANLERAVADGEGRIRKEPAGAHLPGLLEDVVSWQHDPEELEARNLLASIVAELSPQDHPGGHGRGTLAFGPPGEMLGRTGKVPMLKVPYSTEPIPLELASAGIRRIVALAYALVWAWVSHRRTVTARKGMVTAAHQIVFLFDEIEGHLHPQWQRLILPALLRTLGSLGGPDVPVQVICTTHAPLVLASVEPHFDEKTDRLFSFELREGTVTLEQVKWAKQGDALNWLVSETFGLKQARSVEGERAVEAAEAWMRGDHTALPPGLQTAEAIDAELRRVLADNDRFKPRWSFKLAMQRQPGVQSGK